MAIKHKLPKQSIESINFIPAGMGESGWMIYLNEGWSFDPMASDWSRFIPSDALHEALDLVVFRYTAAEKASAAANI
jgi:hypothetical protein